jgi:hypothetical protein
MMYIKRGQERKKERPKIKWYPNTNHRNIPSKTQRRAQRQPHNEERQRQPSQRQPQR